MCSKSVSIEENGRLSNQYSMHTGIVSFWPLFYGLVGESDRIQALLDILGDEGLMLSQFGVRSLSASD